MIQFLPITEGNIIAIRASGKLSHEDYQTFLPKLEEQIKQLGKVSILVELDNFQGWDLKAAKDDFKFGMAHLDDIERFAIVGEKLWERWMAIMAKPFVGSANVRFFSRDELQKAWDWLREPLLLKQTAENVPAYTNIVAGIDFSLHSKRAVKRAVDLAEHYGAQLTLVHVVPEIIPYPVYYGDSITGYMYDPELLAKQNQELIELGKKQLKTYIDSLNSNLDIRSEVLSGDAGSALVSYLEAHNPDLAVLGNEQKTGLSKLLGSTAHYVQNHARCEVLIVPFIPQADFNENTN